MASRIPENDPSGGDGQHLKKHFFRQGLLLVDEIVDRSFLLLRFEIREERAGIRTFVTHAGDSRGPIPRVFAQRPVLGLTKCLETRRVLCSVR
jgi:hypothetical protein